MLYGKPHQEKSLCFDVQFRRWREGPPVDLYQNSCSCDCEITFPFEIKDQWITAFSDFLSSQHEEQRKIFIEQWKGAADGRKPLENVSGDIDDRKVARC